MKKIIIAVLFISSFFFITGAQASERVLYSGECNNGPSNTNAADCGTACLPACDAFSGFNRDFCRQQARDTVAWKKYSVTETEYTSDYDCGLSPGQCSISGGYYYKFTFLAVDDVCSLADKYYPSSSDPYHLYPGHCSCGSVGRSAYKTCCATNSNGTMRTVSAECNSYCRQFELDDYAPPEGNCPSGATTVYGSSCPQPPTVNLTSTCNSDGSMTLRWSSSGADSCSSSDFSTGGRVNNSTGIRIADPSGSYRITCSNDYSFYNTRTNRRDTDSITASDSVTPRCQDLCPPPGNCYRPSAGQNSCSGFDRTQGSTEIDYTPIGNGADCDTTNSGRDLCCEKTCGRCSTVPGNETTWIEWTDIDGTCTQVGIVKSSTANDPRCAPPAGYFCDPTCSALPSGASCTGGVISGSSDPSDNGRSCYAAATCNSTCLRSFYVCRGGSCSSVSYATRPACEAVYGSGSCHDTAAACSANCSGRSCPSGDVTATVNTPNPVCLPGQPGQVTSTNVGWEGRVSNNCSQVIGGGSPSNMNVTCRNLSSNWSVSGSGSSNISGSYTANNINVTQDFALECARDTYTCDWRSSNTDTQAQCLSRDQNLFNCGGCNPSSSGSLCASCSLCVSTCVDYWDSSSDPSGNHCTNWVCDQPDPIDPTKCLVSRRCTSYSCRDNDYYSAKSSKSISGGFASCSDTDSKQVRFMQKPVVIDFHPTKLQILLNQSFDIIWNAVVNSSGAETIFKCTPSINGGDSRNWAEGSISALLNSLGVSGDTTGTQNHLDPDNSTTYGLTCRNNDELLCGQNPGASCSCYNETSATPFEVKVFEPYLQEKSPAFRQIFMSTLGSIIGALRGA